MLFAVVPGPQLGLDQVIEAVTHKNDKWRNDTDNDCGS